MALERRPPSADLYIGIMSGTSLDGVDAALCRFETGEEGRVSLELLAESSVPWPGEFRDLLYELATEQSVEVDSLVRAHFLLPHYYAEAAGSAIREASLTPADIRAIGVHGQTIRHLPKPAELVAGTPAVGATLQLGSGAALAALTGIDVISDFRSADVALGGQGAPLVPIFDNEFLRSRESDRVALNIGGISNITWLPRAETDEVLAYDCGPGNMIIDALTRRWFDRPFDEGGKIASEGKVDERLLHNLLSHEYFTTPPPKSTGRE
jgi:anhydro-N-acetylmuramic acid kinase